MMWVFCVLTDAVLLVYAYGAAAAIRVLLGAPVETFETLLVTMPAFVVLHAASLAALKGYDFSKTRSESDVGFSAVLGVFAATVLSLAASSAFIAYYAPDAQVVPRSVFLIGGALNLVFLPGWRMWYTKQRRKRGELNTRVLVVGPAEHVEAVAKELSEYSRSGHETVGCVSMDAGNSHGSGFLGGVDDLPDLVRKHAVEELLVIGDSLAGSPDTLLSIIELAERMNLKIHILPGFYETMMGKLDLYEIGGLPLIELKPQPVSPAYRYVKRAVDIACALTGLVVGAPILLAAAIAIKRDSPGPAFYRQTRAGLGGREFEMIKLRSMRVDAEKDSGPVWASKEDQRITRVGSFLRKKRIDEIPQLWNVLRGDMSMVGPRPERPFFIEKFKKDIPLFPLRSRVKPGVTSMSHVWGRYDSTPADRLRYDLVYMSNVSFLLDVRILLETIKIVLTGRGAQ